MKLIATKPVSLFWQTLFMILIDVIGVYRIQKLRRYLKIVVLPSVMLTNIPMFFIIPGFANCEPNMWLILITFDTCLPYEMNIFIGSVYGGFLLFSIHLIRKWSIEWNKQFET